MKLQQKQGDVRTVDYANPDSWLNVPHFAEKPVDVFYVYPSAWYRSKDEAFNICPVTHAGMRRGAQTVYPVQASVFFPLANVYAPYYRQLDPMAMLALGFEERKELIRSIPYGDIKAAFAHYIAHWNNGRPFLLAAHSQGTELCRELLFDYMANNKQIYDRMIAAYLIGYGITKPELAAHLHIRFANCGDDTGVVISYNTEAPGCRNENPTVPPETMLINPLSWSRGHQHAPANANLGSLVTGRGRLVVYRQFADATIDQERHTLICSSISPEEYGGPRGLGTYHMLDYALYYLNLRENAAARIRRYMETHP